MAPKDGFRLSCFCIWSAALLFSAYRFFKSSQSFKQGLSERSHVNAGWISHKSKGLQDHGDFEWNFWKAEMVRVFPIHCGRVLLSSLVVFGHWSAFCLSIYDLLACWFLLGFPTIVFQVVLMTIFFVVALAGTPKLIWILTGVVCSFRYIFPLHELLMDLDVYDSYRLECSTCFVVVRAISFAFDFNNHLRKYDEENVLLVFYEYVRYQFFLPLFFIGPIVPYEIFRLKVTEKGTRSGIWMIAAKVILAAFALEVVTHFLYPYSIRYDKHLLQSMDLWSLAGNGYILGQLFQLKYIALFGFFSLFSTLNGLEYFQQPVCVAWVHRYSLMWQWFDAGLYGFLKRYIYRPLAEKDLGKMLSSLGCYVFVLFWHGLSLHMLCWVSLNWITLALESIVYKRIKNDWLRPLLNAPVLIVSMCGNMFFLGENYNFGYQIITRILFSSSISSVLGVWFLFYCCSFAGDAYLMWKNSEDSLDVKKARIVNA